MNPPLPAFPAQSDTGSPASPPGSSCAAARPRLTHGAPWALMLLPGPFYFATERRAYGMVLGFSGLTLLCWHPCIGPGRRPWHPLGLPCFCLVW